MDASAKSETVVSVRKPPPPPPRQPRSAPNCQCEDVAADCQSGGGGGGGDGAGCSASTGDLRAAIAPAPSRAAPGGPKSATAPATAAGTAPSGLAPGGPSSDDQCTCESPSDEARRGGGEVQYGREATKYGREASTPGRDANNGGGACCGGEASYEFTPYTYDEYCYAHGDEGRGGGGQRVDACGRRCDATSTCESGMSIAGGACCKVVLVATSRCGWRCYRVWWVGR